MCDSQKDPTPTIALLVSLLRKSPKHFNNVPEASGTSNLRGHGSSFAIAPIVLHQGRFDSGACYYNTAVRALRSDLFDLCTVSINPYCKLHKY
eukprot:622727-Amphidinium_carterae.1